jgi:hypothetical protein
MIRAARYVYFALAWAFLVGLVVQVFFIGLGLFAGSQNIQLHINFGWIIHLSPILVLIAAAVARAGMRNVLFALALAVTVFIVPLLPGMRGGLPVVAALHPVLALLAFWLAIVVVRNASTLILTDDIAPSTPATPAPG